MANKFDKPNKSTSAIKRKGIKATRGKPLFYSEKKQKTSVMLTPQALAIMDKFASAIGESRSQWLELHLRAIGGQKDS